MSQAAANLREDISTLIYFASVSRSNRNSQPCVPRKSDTPMSRRDASTPRELGRRHADLREDATPLLHASRRNVSTAGAGLQIFVKTLLPSCSRRAVTYRRRVSGAPAGASVQLFVKTLVCLLLTLRHDVWTPGEQGRCLKPLQIFVKTSVR